MQPTTPRIGSGMKMEGFSSLQISGASVKRSPRVGSFSR